MPRTTVKYAFERGLLGWAQEFRQGAGFLAVFGPAGELLEVHEAETTPFGNRLVSHERKAQLIQVHSRWMYFDPFDWPEYAWLQWHQVPRPVLERLLGEPWMQLRSAGLADLPEVPESWGVMF